MTSQAIHLPVVILAGGLATRLHPMTQTIPKSLIPIAGKTFLEHQLALLRSRGVGRVVLCAGHFGKMIQDFLGDGRRTGIKIDYSFDGEHLLGTGGALRKALPLLGDAFFIMYGDSYLPTDYLSIQNAFCKNHKSALMTVYENHGKWDSSNIRYRNGRIEVYDKKKSNPEMKHIDYGLSVMSADVMGAIPLGKTYDLADVFSKLVSSGDLMGYEVFERFYEIGSKQGLLDFENFINATSLSNAKI